LVAQNDAQYFHGRICAAAEQRNGENMYYDLSITLNEQTLPFLPTGDPHMVWAHRADHAFALCQASIVLMPSHMGTHVDAPRHFVPDGKTTAEIDLSRYAGEAVCIAIPDFPHSGEYDLTDELAKYKDFVKSGDIIILSTGYEKLVGSEEYFDFPDFAENTGALLESYGIRAIGLDTPTLGQQNRVHQEVLGREIAVYESLINLEPLIGKRFFISAMPLKFEDGDGSPVRAYAIIND
jgi:kynurenine formamidase